MAPSHWHPPLHALPPLQTPGAAHVHFHVQLHVHPSKNVRTYQNIWNGKWTWMIVHKNTDKLYKAYGGGAQQRHQHCHGVQLIIWLGIISKWHLIMRCHLAAWKCLCFMSVCCSVSGFVTCRLELETKVRNDFTMTEKAPIRTSSWLKVPTSTFKTLC